MAERNWHLAFFVRMGTHEIVRLQVTTECYACAQDGFMLVPMFGTPMTHEEAKKQVASPWWSWVGPLDKYGDRCPVETV